MTARPLSRRHLLAAGFGGGAAFGLAPRRAGGQEAGRPPAVGRKFHPDGRVRRWPGNTIICFVQTAPDLWRALATVQEAARAEPVMRAFALLPPPSFHMTVFAGLDEDHRYRPYWPASLPADMPLAEARAWCRQRLTGFHTGGGRFRMRIERPALTGPVKDFSVRLSPADSTEADRLRDIRRRLSERLQIAPPHLDAYRFHITLGYLTDWLTPQQNAEFVRNYQSLIDDICDNIQIFLIGPPVLCDFRDMSDFKPVLALSD